MNDIDKIRASVERSTPGADNLLRQDMTGEALERYYRDNMELCLARWVLNSETKPDFERRASLLGRMCRRKGSAWADRVRAHYAREKAARSAKR